MGVRRTLYTHTRGYRTLRTRATSSTADAINATAMALVIDLARMTWKCLCIREGGQGSQVSNRGYIQDSAQDSEEHRCTRASISTRKNRSLKLNGHSAASRMSRSSGRQSTVRGTTHFEGSRRGHPGRSRGDRRCMYRSMCSCCTQALCPRHSNGHPCTHPTRTADHWHKQHLAAHGMSLAPAGTLTHKPCTRPWHRCRLCRHQTVTSHCSKRCPSTSLTSSSPN
jgi:hypothetical protein